MQAQSSPWPEIPLSPMIKSGVPDSTHNGWQASHTGRSSSLGGDGSSSEHSEAAQAANPRMPVSFLHTTFQQYNNISAPLSCQVSRHITPYTTTICLMQKVLQS